MEIFEVEGYDFDSINYIFCSDKYLLDINRNYLQHDYYTDVITFSLSAPDQPVQAEVYISIDRVKANAILLSELFQRELHRVIFHAALHLCGYNDKSTRELNHMRKKETDLLNKYFNVSRGTSSSNSRK